MAWAPDYVTTALLKSYLRIDDNADDAFIARWITAVSRNIDDHCGRQFGKVATEDRWYTPIWDRHDGAWFADIDDLQDTTGLAFTTEAGAAVAPSNYRLWPRNAATRGRPYEQVRLTSWSGGELTGRAPWGWSAVPPSVEEGLLLQGARLAARRDSPFGISGSPGEQGEIRLLAQLDPDFRTTLKPYVRRWWAR